MLDNMYSKLTEKIDYKLLLFLPIILSILLVFVVFVNGIPLGLDFQGGTWSEVVTQTSFGSAEISSLEADLSALGLENLDVYPGKDILSGKSKVTIVTTSQLDEAAFKAVLASHVGELHDFDSAVIPLSEKPSEETITNFKNRFNADAVFDEDAMSLTITSLEIDDSKLQSTVGFYFGEGTVFELDKKNINIKPVGETLGTTFREQGKSAVLFAYLLIIAVIFFAFRDLIPSLAVILAGTCDALIALGGMSIFGIHLEPSSLVALLMLVGYSVDSDILLTTRVLRTKELTVNQRIDNAMKTGLTMTGTTLVVMLVIILVSTFLFQIETLSIIASVLLLGLVGDVMTTWFMNAGILKWYVEEKGGKLNLLKSGKRRK